MSQDCNTFGIFWSEVWSWLSREVSSSSWLRSRGGLPRGKGVKIFPFEVNQIIWTFLTSTLRLLGLIQWHMVTLKDLQHPYQSCLSGFNMCEFSPAIFPHFGWRYQLPAQLWGISPEIAQSSSSSHGYLRRAEGSGTECSRGTGEPEQWNPRVHRWNGKLFNIYLQPFVLFKLAVYLQSNREKTLKLLWEPCREESKEFGSSRLQQMLLSWGGGSAGSSLSPRVVAELDDSMLRLMGTGVFDWIVVTALSQTFSVISCKMLKVPVIRIVSFEMCFLKDH